MLVKNHTDAHKYTHKNVTRGRKRLYDRNVLMKYSIIIHTIIIVHKYYYDIVMVNYIAPIYRYCVYIYFIFYE